MTGKVLHSLSDLNGDGIADLVTFSLEDGSISSKRSTSSRCISARQQPMAASRSHGTSILRSSRTAASNSGWTDATLIAMAKSN